MAKTERRVVRRMLAIPVLAGAFLMSPLVGTASAQAGCDIENFTAPDGSIDLTSYLACVAAAGQGQGGGGALPRTGSDVGELVGIGSGLIALGAAAVWGSRRRPAHAPAHAAD